MIIFLTTFFLAFTLICAKNIRYGIYAVIFSMPLYLVRFSIFGIPSTVLEIMIYILFLVWIFGRIRKNNFYPALAEGFSGFNRSCKNNFTLSIGIALLFLGLTISTLNSTDLRTSFGIFKGWFFDPFLFFIVFTSVIKKNDDIILSLKSWVFSGVTVSLISIFYLLNNELTFDGRLKAFFLSPNHLAMYLAPAFLIALFFLLNKRVFSIFLLIIFVPLYFTYSYGAFLGIFAGILYLASRDAINCVSTVNIFRNRVSGTRNSVSVYVFLLIIIFAGFIFISSNKFNQIINSDSRSSFHSRLMIWNSAGEIIKDNPLFGIGPGTFQKTYLFYAEKFDEQYLEWAVPQPHNIFLAFYLQTGLIGFVGFILILFWFFRRRNEALPRSYNVINALMIYILIHGLVDTTYWKNDLSLMFWIIIGMKFVEKLAIDPVRNFTKKYTENKLSKGIRDSRHQSGSLIKLSNGVDKNQKVC